MSIALAKKDLRSRVKIIVGSLSPDYLSEAGAAIARHLSSWLALYSTKAIQRVAVFAAMPDELATDDINEMLRAKKYRRYQAYIGNDGSLSFVDIDDNSSLQGLPIDPNKLDLMLLPARALDLHGHRLGRGAAHYDRTLALIARGDHSPVLIGLALDEQVFDQIPTDIHDMPVDYICTPKLGVVRAKPAVTTRNACMNS